MIEFNLKIRIDTQDEQYAYNLMRQSLQYCGLDVIIQDTWLKNNRPLPVETADICAAKWLATHDPLSIDRRIKHTGRWHDEYVRFMEVVDSLPTYEDLMKERNNVES